MNKIVVKYLEKNDIRDVDFFRNIYCDRWENACRAYRSGDYFAAVYLSGYSAECILKYIIIKCIFYKKQKTTRIINLNEELKQDRSLKALTTHKLGKLIELGNAKSIFKTPKDVDHKEILGWTSEWRYAISHTIDKENAEAFLLSIERLSKELKRECSSANIKVKILRFGGEQDGSTDQ